MNPVSPSSPQGSPDPTSSTLPYRPPRSSDAPDTPIPDDDHGADLPMNMSASVMLTNLPRYATQALADVETIDSGKGGVSIFHRWNSN